MSIRLMLRVAVTVLIGMASLVMPSRMADAQLNPIRIVALGDSYTAGNGALNYENRDCYRSENAYVHQYAQSLRDRGHSASSQNYACSNAVTSDLPGQIEAAGGNLADADIVVLTIGGNDANFADIVLNCLAPISRHLTLCHDDIDRARESLDEIMTRIQSDLELIRSKIEPSAQIVLIGYPFLIASNCFADADIVRSLQSAADINTFLTVYGMKDDRISYLSMLVPFTGGEVCGEGQNGLYLRGFGDTADKNEWYHPNREGHGVIARELIRSGIHQKVLNSSPPTPTYQLPPPIEGTNGYVNLPFECGVVVPYASTYESYNYNGRVINHSLALDFPMIAGTPVVAVESGRVELKSDPSGYGNYIDLTGDSGTVHRTAHLQSFSVADGQRVARGATIGIVGSTGASTGPHVHYEQLRQASQIPIDLGGPALSWSMAQDASGYRTTLHGLLSQNCGSQQISDRFADIITLSYNHFTYGRSDGYDRNGWGTVKQDVFVPSSVDSCDVDGDGWSEFLAYDAPTHRIMVADPKVDPNGHFFWRQFGYTQTADSIVCGDWNGDGLDDVMFHNVNNSIYFGRSDGDQIAEWRVALVNAGGAQTYWDMCDINGDGAVDLVSYHAATHRFLVGYRTSDVGMKRLELLPGIYNLKGFACGNLVAGGADEIIGWQPEQNGRYMLGIFGRDYRANSWQAMSPVGLSEPYQGEVVAADVDGDGLDEFIVNEYRPRTDDHSVMIGDLVSPTHFEWHTFKDGMQSSFLSAGFFVN